ncbi:MAG: hypothetical protein Q9197_005126 [Variospora fuerteventurae]
MSSPKIFSVEETKLEEKLRRGNPTVLLLLRVESHVLEHPRECKNIVSYWKSQSDFLFLEQSKAWREVYNYQQKLRRYFIQRNRFPEYQQRVRDLRRKHGIEGDVTELEDLDQQKKTRLEIFEKKVDEAHQNHQKLKLKQEAGRSGYEGVVEEDNVGNHLSLKFVSSDKSHTAENPVSAAQEELDLAKKKLETAQSDRIAVTVTRSTWVGLCLDEVEAARVRLNEIRKDRIPSPGPEGLWEASKEWLAWAKWHRADVNASSKERFAEKALLAAQSDDFGETVERAALIRSLLEDVELAQTRLDEAIASQRRSMLETARIKGDVLGALCLVVDKKRDLERHKILVEWVERQRRARAFDCATSAQNTKNHNDQTLNRKSNQRLLRNHSGQASRPGKSFDGPSLRKTRAQTRSILSTTNPSKVSKATRRKDKSTRRQKKNSLSSEQSAQAASINPSVHHTRSKQTSIIKQNTTPTPLRPIHSSKVIHSNRRQPTGQQANGMEGFGTADQLQTYENSAHARHHLHALPARNHGESLLESQHAPVLEYRRNRRALVLHAFDVQLHLRTANSSFVGYSSTQVGSAPGGLRYVAGQKFRS